MKVDTTTMVPAAKLVGEDEEETRELNALTKAATEFVDSFEWCERIEEMYSAVAIPAVIGVFLVRIVPRDSHVDDELWVIVGDLPPAYLVTDDAPNAVSAIEIYIGLMQEWVDAVEADRSVLDLVPVNAHPSRAAASMLQSRLDFLSSRILPEYRNRS